MKKICFLIGNLNHSGGTERVTTLVANELAINGYQVAILSITDGMSPFFPLHKNIKTDYLFLGPVSMKRNLLGSIFKIRKYLIDNKINTLVVVDSISCVFTVPACYGLKINHICWEHFNLKVNLNSKFRDLGRWMAAKWCDSIITLTERDKFFWDEKFHLINTDKVIAIANPSPYEIQDNIPLLESKIILCVGRLTPQKGFDLLLLAWSKISKRLPGWKIIIVGIGEDEDMLKQMLIDLNINQSVDFVGQQKNMDLFYRKASIFCMSSRFEGLPMVLLEAQSYGLPIISFDCDTGPAELIDNNRNGFLSKAEDVESLSKHIFNIANFEEEYFLKFIFEAKQSAKKFQIGNIIKKWDAVIGSLNK